MRDPRYYCVYIMGSLTGTLYIGVSGNLHKRVFQHKFHHYEGFTARYEVVRLLHWESYDDVHKAYFAFKFNIHGLGAPKPDRHGQHVSLPCICKMQLSCQDRQ